jgi:hypothetical protein
MITTTIKPTTERFILSQTNNNNKKGKEKHTKLNKNLNQLNQTKYKNKKSNQIKLNHILNQKRKLEKDCNFDLGMQIFLVGSRYK